MPIDLTSFYQSWPDPDWLSQLEAATQPTTFQLTHTLINSHVRSPLFDAPNHWSPFNLVKLLTTLTGCRGRPSAICWTPSQDHELIGFTWRINDHEWVAMRGGSSWSSDLSWCESPSVWGRVWRSLANAAQKPAVHEQSRHSDGLIKSLDCYWALPQLRPHRASWVNRAEKIELIVTSSTTKQLAWNWN